MRGRTDAFNPALAARGADPLHYLDRNFQPLLNKTAWSLAAETIR
jgi:hypothetical protein